MQDYIIRYGVTIVPILSHQYRKPYFLHGQEVSHFNTSRCDDYISLKIKQAVYFTIQANI